jgi:hypothetical protein
MNNREVSYRIHNLGMAFLATGGVLAAMALVRLLDGVALIPTLLPFFTAASLCLTGGLLILRSVRQGKFDLATLVVGTEDDYRLARTAERTNQTIYDPVRRRR